MFYSHCLTVLFLKKEILYSRKLLRCVFLLNLAPRPLGWQAEALLACSLFAELEDPSLSAVAQHCFAELPDLALKVAPRAPRNIAGNRSLPSIADLEHWYMFIKYQRSG